MEDEYAIYKLSKIFDKLYYQKGIEDYQRYVPKSGVFRRQDFFHKKGSI